MSVPPEIQPAVRQVVDLVGQGDVFVLTGAGLSTDSGIPDYRGRDGIRRVMPMQYGEFVASSQARRRYWARSYVGWQRFRAARPNAGHHAVTALQQLGVVELLVTQNVDGLHTAAGSPDVVELHGSLARVVCLTCRTDIARSAVQGWLSALNPGFVDTVRQTLPGGSQVSSQIRPDGDIVLPDEAIGDFALATCPRCGADTLKPDVVFFGESVPKPRVQRCVDALDRARSVLVLGSSLAVMSGYRFVRQAARSGTPVAIVTHGPTRGDDQADVTLDAPLTSTLQVIAAALGSGR